MLKLEIAPDLRLQTFAPENAPELFRLVDANRARLREWLPWLDKNTEVSGSEYFIRASLEALASNRAPTLGIWKGERLAGVVGLHAIDWETRNAPIGYWIGAAFAGGGLVTTAVKRLMEYSFGELGLESLEIRCAVGNVPSARIAERLGFEFREVKPDAEWLYDHHVDHKVFVMTKACHSQLGEAGA